MISWKQLRPYVMITPALLVFIIFFIYPIGYMIQLSFFDWDFVSPTRDFVGLQNFSDLLGSEGFRQVLNNTVVYTFLTVTFTIVIALLLALWLNRAGGIFGFVQGAIFTPHIIALVSVAMLWMWLFDPQYGLINWMLTLVGLPQSEWLTHPNTSLISLVIVAVWKSVGFNALVFIAGLQSIPKDMYEAAELDQSSRWTTFYKITLPMLSPTLFFLVVINVIGSFQVFESIQIMTQGGPINSTSTLVYYIYEYGFRYFQIGYASAAGVILLIVISIMTFFYFHLLSKRVHYR
ncbi:carbohydrate ABC transporter permease [Salipaludibacillus sp. HK11]|uniref:carbohydrate ABC transporter permease n=1 Tax=Salipaludibacillus sp. HK11 TaxID=3394320 RepID=UPI0039FD2DAE